MLTASSDLHAWLQAPAECLTVCPVAAFTSHDGLLHQWVVMGDQVIFLHACCLGRGFK